MHQTSDRVLTTNADAEADADCAAKVVFVLPSAAIVAPDPVAVPVVAVLAPTVVLAVPVVTPEEVVVVTAVSVAASSGKVVNGPNVVDEAVMVPVEARVKFAERQVCVRESRDCCASIASASGSPLATRQLKQFT
jgi:hypothetical protein